MRGQFASSIGHAAIGHILPFSDLQSWISIGKMITRTADGREDFFTGAIQVGDASSKNYSHAHMRALLVAPLSTRIVETDHDQLSERGFRIHVPMSCDFLLSCCRRSLIPL